METDAKGRVDLQEAKETCETLKFHEERDASWGRQGRCENDGERWLRRLSYRLQGCLELIPRKMLIVTVHSLLATTRRAVGGQVVGWKVEEKLICR